ncbi:uncharacterized protein LOC131249287 [Magnolia sinica]|uniref:uncharacterized protein LOC131249287 n=1 Tax=Magnolia sinica TaxID=86752 RepID=UPI002657BDDB|nr:uncharacterized protein LOC131249287 [Magnolia sinica]XP_058105925.1 uncharacterized protein LOC131249287 [Magnolia sinica]XP_058105926.1 uncharacterized protein LOC131249287 [Magnolia sinica]XP_058105927.1 uncharacterized protein LOC131249287 [Magnolia sinica]XP_058105928.1 uncharacterized protein LOC131249287 [Magnolia sinica]XP_058105929.1 uncharacterized protein LOC131249287 [Magnolia sinica]
MEGGGTEQDYDEFEMLLGEIPNVTAANPHPEESSPVVSASDLKAVSLKKDNAESSPSTPFTNFYNTSQTAKHGGSATATLYGSLSFERPVCMNNSQGPFDHKLNTDGGKISIKNEYQTPITNVDCDEPKLPDDHSLSSAFAELSFKDGVAMEPVMPGPVKYKTIPDHAYLMEGQYPNFLMRSFSGLDSVSAAVPPSPNALNSMNLVGPTSEPFPSLTNTNRLDKFNSGAMPFPPGMHAFQMLPDVRVPGMEFPVSPFQQQYYLDGQSPPYMQPQHLSRSHMPLRHTEEERLCRMHQQYFYLQQLQNHGSEVHQIQAGANLPMGPLARSPRQHYFELPISHQIEQANQESFWNTNTVPRGISSSDLMPMGRNLCRFYAQGFCGRGDSCPFAHGEKQMSATGLNCPPAHLSSKELQAFQVLDKGVRQNFPEKILTRSHGLNSLIAIKPCSIGVHEPANHANSNGRVFSNGHLHHPSVTNAGSFQLDGRSSRDSSPDNLDFRYASRSQQQKYNSVDEIVGRIYLLAKDQHGCRFLQKKFAEGSSEDIRKIFVEIIGHIVELMTDPFGNYLIQKLLEVCNEDQRMQILQTVTRKPDEIIKISCNMHGTRAIQKVIETLKTPEQISMVISSLKPGIVMLIKDANGNHVAQRCLSCLMPEYSEFLFEAATAHCVELATDRHGCCVLQKCLQHSDGEPKHLLMSEITSNALALSQDPYGNYVVQYIIDQGIPWATANVLDQLEGSFGYLSMQKYSSNVVEKCLKSAGEERLTRIIHELINNSRLGQILQDPYGNYVVQSALAESKGAIHAAFVEAIRPHVPALRSSPYGKKVLSSHSLKK